MVINSQITRQSDANPVATDKDVIICICFKFIFQKVKEPDTPYLALYTDALYSKITVCMFYAQNLARSETDLDVTSMILVKKPKT